MKPEQLRDIGYPSNITELIGKDESIQLIEETVDQYIIHDTYNEEDRVLHINKEPGLRDEQFCFFNNEIDKDAILSFAKTLPDILYMNLNKVYFVEKEQDLLGEVDEESPNHTFFFSGKEDPLGMSVYRDSIAFVNLNQARATAREEEKDDLLVLGYSKGEEAYFMDIVLQTLAHELFHLTQFNPLIEELIPEGEEAAETFCRHY
ncbi:hypothetical protein QTG56_24860 (plasmid) [Rossellomorea sp. AcN35-11]|nr:hypothetical protein [Rossellomorea aquimaris]WJV31867.1 hypothetical protein QTG56_24860 [Rossellomorea sp. AcN35-11]